MRDDHWYALAIGERSSEGVVTCVNARNPARPRQPCHARKTLPWRDLRRKRHHPLGVILERVATLRGLGNLSHLRAVCQRPATDSVINFTEQRAGARLIHPMCLDAAPRLRRDAPWAVGWGRWSCVPEAQLVADESPRPNIFEIDVKQWIDMTCTILRGPSSEPNRCRIRTANYN